MAETKRLSRTEWKMMNICWRLGPATARQVWEESLAERERGYRTVKTLLDRVAAKGYLAIDKVGPVSVYRPLVGRARAVGDAIGRFVSEVLDESVAPLYLHLAERDDLEPEEIEEIRRILDEKEAER